MLIYIVSGIIIILSILNLILKNSKAYIVKAIFGFAISLSLIYLEFDGSKYLGQYYIVAQTIEVLYLVFLSLMIIPKKVSKNLTEYDYFELEKTYNETINENDKLRERFISTIGLIDQGIIFYENNLSSVILSDKAVEIFPGPSQLEYNEHLSRIFQDDRSNYERTVEVAALKNGHYEVKYRVINSGKLVWVEEKGEYIKVDRKKSIISTIKPLNINTFQQTSFFDIDSLYTEAKMREYSKLLLDNNKQFVIVYFELTNLPKINKKYGRDVGNMLINDYIKLVKNNYAKGINNLYRITGIEFAMILDDPRSYEDFHKALLSQNSQIYNININIAGLKDTIEPKFGVIKVSETSHLKLDELFKLSDKALQEAKEATRRSYSIFGE